MEKKKNRWELIRELLKTYWWVIVIILIAPVFLNFIILIPAFSPIVGSNSEWLSFHGSYIGSVISSMITLLVLYKQLQYNHEENEETRRENQTVNEKNRHLQLNILKYEQERQWLQEMRSACINNIDSYNLNDIREVCTAFTSHNYEYISPKIKNIIDKLDYTDTTVCSLLPIEEDESTYTFRMQRETSYKKYMLMIQDIEILAIFLNKDYVMIQEGLSYARFSSEVKNNVNAKIVRPCLSSITDVNAQLAQIALDRLYTQKNIYVHMRTESFNYLKEQQKRINKILTEEHSIK